MLRVEVQKGNDGRWIAEVPELSGVQAYGASENEAGANVKALAFRVIADRLEHGEPVPADAREFFERLEQLDQPAFRAADTPQRFLADIESTTGRKR
jgi:predicted RNase H-like HicB family nuclease